jgi:hypothetical protein
MDSANSTWTTIYLRLNAEICETAVKILGLEKVIADLIRVEALTTEKVIAEIYDSCRLVVMRKVVVFFGKEGECIRGQTYIDSMEKEDLN